MNHEKTLRSIARTIEHVGRKIKRDVHLDPSKVKAMAKLVSSYQKLLQTVVR